MNHLLNHPEHWLPLVIVVAILGATYFWLSKSDKHREEDREITNLFH